MVLITTNTNWAMCLYSNGTCITTADNNTKLEKKINNKIYQGGAAWSIKVLAVLDRKSARLSGTSIWKILKLREPWKLRLWSRVEMKDSRKIITLSQGCTASGPLHLFSSILTAGNAICAQKHSLLIVALNKYFKKTPWKQSHSPSLLCYIPLRYS